MFTSYILDSWHTDFWPHHRPPFPLVSSYQIWLFSLPLPLYCCSRLNCPVHGERNTFPWSTALRASRSDEAARKHQKNTRKHEKNLKQIWKHQLLPKRPGSSQLWFRTWHICCWEASFAWRTDAFLAVWIAWQTAGIPSWHASWHSVLPTNPINTRHGVCGWLGR